MFAAAVFSGPLRADDSYRFLPSGSSAHAITPEETPTGARWRWPDARAWDTALLGLRLRALESGADDPWVEFATGNCTVRQYLERDVHGLRWLNLTGLRAHLRSGSVVNVSGHGVSIAAGPAELRLFANHLGQKERVLILAPHPDDAEIAAFGFYADGPATIVTVTCGNAGDANYQDHFTDAAEQYRFKGFLRAVDSVTVPWLGGIPPERCFNLGYFDARLQAMHASPKAVVPELYGPNTDVSVYRKANIGHLLPKGSRANSWAHLVDDLAEVFRKVRPTVIVMPHPFLDSHRDHDFTAVAAVEALDRWKGMVRLLLYTNHAAENRYPYGPAGTSAPLPPWSGRELVVEGFYAHPLAPELQRRKLFALDGMHDLRLSPVEQAACVQGNAKPHRDDYPRIPAVDYFRRAPRPEELFFVFSREGARQMIHTFVAEVKD
jgi:LmbE family N-acetylglucosaminyl deacetylase